MIVLFFPKLLLFFKKGQQYDGSANAAGGRRPDVSGRLRPMADRLSNPRQIGGGGGGPPGAEETFTKNRELISINRMLASPNPLGSTFMPARKSSVVPHHLSNNDSVLEAHEVCTYRPLTHIMACSSYILIGPHASASCFSLFSITRCLGYEACVSFSTSGVLFILLGKGIDYVKSGWQILIVLLSLGKV